MCVIPVINKIGMSRLVLDTDNILVFIPIEELINYVPGQKINNCRISFHESTSEFRKSIEENCVWPHSLSPELKCMITDLRKKSINFPMDSRAQCLIICETTLENLPTIEIGFSEMIEIGETFENGAERILVEKTGLYGSKIHEITLVRGGKHRLGGAFSVVMIRC